MLTIVRTVADPPRPPTYEGWPPLAVLPLTAEDVPGVVWEDYEIDGLGRFRGACVEIEGGFVYGLQWCLEEVVPHTGIEVHAFVDPARLPGALEALLRAAGLTRTDLVWVTPVLG